MKNLVMAFVIIFMLFFQRVVAQNKVIDYNQINDIIREYTRCVTEKDSVAFYALFNEGTVTWCAAIKEASMAKAKEEQGNKKRGTNYFADSYKGFMRGLFHLTTAKDLFDNIHIVEDGTVATVTMDYSFWANGKMTNWGGKYMMLIKRNGSWKITSVTYSLELTRFFKQPSLEERQKTT